MYACPGALACGAANVVLIIMLDNATTIIAETTPYVKYFVFISFVY